MRPLICGYLRIWTDTSEDVAARTERELIDFAEREGFTAVEIFVERPYLPVTAFDGLIQGITRTETKDIVVPDLSHFCPYHGLGKAMKAILEHVGGARVWVIGPWGRIRTAGQAFSPWLAMAGFRPRYRGRGRSLDCRFWPPTTGTASAPNAYAAA